MHRRQQQISCHAHARVRTHTNTHKHTHKHTHTHTHTHTSMHRRQTVYGWKHAIESNKLVATHTHNRLLASLSSRVALWLQHTEATTKQYAAAVRMRARRQQLELAMRFVRWLQESSHRELRRHVCVCGQVRTWQRAELRRVFNGWVYSSVGRTRYAHVCACVVRKSGRAELLRIFNIWRYYCTTQKTQRCQLDYAVEPRHAQHVRPVCPSLASCSSPNSVLAYTLHSVVKRYNQQAAAQVFDVWRSLCAQLELQQHCFARSVERTWCRRVLVHMCGAWRCQSLKGIALRHLKKCVGRKWRRVMLAHGFERFGYS